MPATLYIWDIESNNILVETDAADLTTAVYTAEPEDYGYLVSQRRGHEDSYYQFDALGSTRQLCDSNETVTDNYSYSAFGNLVETSGSTTNPFRFVGQLGYYHDASTELYYIRARSYEPATARWASQDPLGYEDGLNRYTYVRANPTNATDPSGLETREQFCLRVFAPPKGKQAEITTVWKCIKKRKCFRKRKIKDKLKCLGICLGKATGKKGKLSIIDLMCCHVAPGPSGSHGDPCKCGSYPTNRRDKEGKVVCVKGPCINPADDVNHKLKGRDCTDCCRVQACRFGLAGISGVSDLLEGAFDNKTCEINCIGK